MKIIPTHPLISCICITDSRPESLLRSVICFDTQSYPNKELVISYPEDDLETKKLVELIIHSSGLNILTVSRNREISLGAARNDAIAQCNGEYVCIWDDDDWYHYKRLIHQFNSLKTPGEYYEASILNQILIYDTTEELGFLSCKFKWGGTLLCKKSLLLQYPYLDKLFLEDNDLIHQLESRKLLKQLSDSYDLYIMVYHGNNSFNHFHFIYLMKTSSVLDLTSIKWMQNITAVNIEIK